MVTKLLLLPSPLLPVSAYSGLAASLEQAGADVRLAPPTPDGAPDAKMLVRTWAAMVCPGTTLVAHSNAGYLAPSVRSRAGTGTDARVIFMDAALPPESGPTLLAPRRFRDHLSSLAGDDGLLPPWTRWWHREDLDAVIPAHDFDELDRDCPRLPVSYFDTQLETPPGWVAAPNAYLAFGATYAQELSLAQERGWPHTVATGGHMHFLVDSVTVAALTRTDEAYMDGNRCGTYPGAMTQLQGSPVPLGADECCAGADCELMPKDRAEGLAVVLRALADPTRVRLLQYLAESESGTACACHLPAALGITQPTLSHHMRKLHGAGLVERERRGRWVHYTVRSEALARVRAFLELPVRGVAQRCC